MKLDFLEKIYFVTLFSQLNEEVTSKIYDIGAYETVGCFINKKEAVQVLKENGTEFVNRKGCRFAMVSTFMLGEVFPKALEVDVFKASSSKIQVPTMDTILCEVYYTEEESHSFEFYSINEEIEKALICLKIPFEMVEA